MKIFNLLAILFYHFLFSYAINILILNYGVSEIRNIYSENISVERYLSPVSGKSATIIFPLFSGRFAS